MKGDGGGRDGKIGRVCLVAGREVGRIGSSRKVYGLGKSRFNCLPPARGFNVVCANNSRGDGMWFVGWVLFAMVLIFVVVVGCWNFYSGTVICSHPSPAIALGTLTL